MEHDLLHHNIIFFVCMKIELRGLFLKKTSTFFYFCSSHAEKCEKNVIESHQFMKLKLISVRVSL